MDLAPDLPSPVIRRYLELLEAGDDDGIDLFLRREGRRGADLGPELAATLALAHELPPPEALELQDAVTEVAAASGADELLELVLRDLPRRSDEMAFDSVTSAFEDDADAWSRACLNVRRAAVEAGDHELARCCLSLLPLAAPGTPGVLDALLADVLESGASAITDLCQHGDARALETVLAWARTQPAIDALDDSEAMTLYSAYRSAMEWGAELADADFAHANAARAMVREDLGDAIAALEDELADARALLAEIRPLRVGRILSPGGTGFGRTPSGAVGRNAPCPCGSGLKAKKCCH